MATEKKEFTIKDLQTPKSEEKIRRPTDPDAAMDEIDAAKESCVDNLCGCKS